MWSIGNEIGEADRNLILATVKRLVCGLKMLLLHVMLPWEQMFRFGDGSGGHEKIAENSMQLL